VEHDLATCSLLSQLSIKICSIFYISLSLKNEFCFKLQLTWHIIAGTTWKHCGNENLRHDLLWYLITLVAMHCVGVSGTISWLHIRVSTHLVVVLYFRVLNGKHFRMRMTHLIVACPKQMTHKVVSDRTYNVLNRTLNPSVPIPTLS